MRDINALSLSDLYAHLHGLGGITGLLNLAKLEDLGTGPDSGDLTGRAFVPGYIRVEAKLVCRKGAVISGLACGAELLHVFEADADIKCLLRDGDRAEAGQTVALLRGRLRDVLTVERTILNLVGRLSGIATHTACYVAAAKNAPGSRAQVLDTRKTTPGLRHLEKYAVRCGGGCCHRLGLYDAVLIKDNHIAGLESGVRQDFASAVSAGSPGASSPIAPPTLNLAAEVRRAVKVARDNAPREGLAFIELEVDTLEQLQSILAADGCGVHIVLLDNMSTDQLAQAVALRDRAGIPLLLEASGGVNLDTVAAIASTGVDRISIGGLTHQATSVDVGLDIP